MSDGALITGATGYIGGRLLERLLAAGSRVGAGVRSPERSRDLGGERTTIHRVDVLDSESLAAIDQPYDVAYYLVHSMGRGSGGGADFERRESQGAENFARWARTAGVSRVVYLGGLGGTSPGSAHLRSRQRVGEILRDQGPPLTWLRAGMVVGAGSESYRTLRSLVERLPVMISPAWLSTPTQAIAIADVLEYLAHAPDVAAREIQIGAPEVLTYGTMLDRMAAALGRRRPIRIPVPLLTPWLSSHWIGLVTPVDAGVARPLVEGLSTDTTVTDPSGMALFDGITPIDFDAALRAAIAEENRA